jgi:predicted lipid-binding transport protein (Tim44 family)
VFFLKVSEMDPAVRLYTAWTVASRAEAEADAALTMAIAASRFANEESRAANLERAAALKELYSLCVQCAVACANKVRACEYVFAAQTTLDGARDALRELKEAWVALELARVERAAAIAMLAEPEERG